MSIFPGRPLSSFSITDEQLHTLYQNGYITAKDLNNISSEQLSRECGFSKENSIVIKSCIEKELNQIPIGRNVFELLNNFSNQITTCSLDFDELINRGIQLGEITEISGFENTGKTQLCLQLCLSVQIPTVLSGLESESIFISTKGMPSSNRLFGMATALSHLMSSVASDNNIESQISNISTDSLLSHIYIWSIFEYNDLVSLLTTLPSFLLTHKKVKLLTIDSIYFPIRYSFSKDATMYTSVNKLLQLLYSIANEFNIAIVITNNMISISNESFTKSNTTQISSNSTTSRSISGLSIENNMTNKNQNSSYINRQALGPSWNHNISTSIILHSTKIHYIKKVLISKSNSCLHRQCSIAITSEGIRDVSEQDKQNIE